MKIRMLTLTVALMALPATTTFADVDCQMIVQELKAGRTPQGLVNGHRIDENDIKVCQAQADREAWQARMRGNDSVPDGSAAMPELPKQVDDRAK
jgi:hypothetical protein